MKSRWSLWAALPAAADLAVALKISPLLAQCLLNRGLTDPLQIGRFLEPRLQQLADPFLLPNMGGAVDRLWLARERAEPVIIFGDYDVDGVASTALLHEVLSQLGWKVHCYLPHRLDEGYGLTQDALQKCLQHSPAKLLLAVDCGSTAVACIEWLSAQGVDTIVLDHHQLGSALPPAVALVNPQLVPSAEINFHELCSGGLAFKLAHALVKAGRQKRWPAALQFDLRPLLDLVALATIADMVPLTGENRILVSAGLQRLNSTRRPGLLALMEVAGIRRPIGPYEVSFQLAPRLNAAGRLENALQALDLLLATDRVQAEPLAQALDQQNRTRQQIEKEILNQVLTTVRAKFNPSTDFVIVEGQALWHLGVVGIVASRVLREFYRPTVIIGGDGEQWRGSGRSIEGFDLAAALRGCADLLTRHGGHAMAAGLSLPGANLELLRSRLNDFARQSLGTSPLTPTLRLDSQVDLRELTLSQLHELDRLQPLGQGNPPVQFMTKALTHHRPPQRLGADQQHVKLWVTDGTAALEAVWWNCDQQNLPKDRFHLAVAPQINNFNQHRSVQLKVLDWQAL